MKKLWSVLVVLLCVMLLFCACNEDPQTLDKMIADCFDGEPYDISFTSRGNGTCFVSDVIFNPNYVEEYTLVIPAKSPSGDIVTNMNDYYFAFYSVEAKNVPCVMTENTYMELEAALKVSEGEGKESYLASKFTTYYERQDISLAQTPATREAMIKRLPLLAHQVLYTLKTDITADDLSWLSNALTQYASYTEEHKEQVYEELTEFSKGKCSSALFYIGSQSAKHMTAVELPDSLEKIQRGALAGCTRLENICFAGTKAQWAAIEKDEGWNEGVPATVVHCTDGDVPIGE